MPPKFFKKFSNKASSSRTIHNHDIKINEHAKYLIIVESPSKCEKIESYLGIDYCCIASKGHIRKIDGLKSINVENNFEPMFSIMEEKKDHIQKMKKVIENFSKDKIILASDDDREGEAIAWHICQVFDLPVETTKRIIFHEVTKPALQEAIKNPTCINMDLVHAQHARQVLDILVGYKISPYLWKYVYNNKSNSLSAGRCQTPALRLVYDNYKEKTTNIETKYKTIGAFFSTKQLLYELNKEFENENEVLEFLEKSKDFTYELKIHPEKKSIRSAPKPFHTSRLLQVASNILQYSPKETMELCQTLYQSGYITYMRTESSQYSPIFLKKAEEYIETKYGKGSLGDLSRLENKDTSNPHEAIRVTNIETVTINSESTRLVSMYKLIWKNTIQSCMADAIYNNIKTTITAPLGLEYEHIIEIPVHLHWKKLDEKEKNHINDMNSNTILMYLNSILTAKNKIKYEWIESSIVVRNKHQHYTEASLIHKLEELGIGRPSTFATIVDTIIDRGYVKKMNVEGSPILCKEFKLVDKEIEKNDRKRIFGNEHNKLVIQPIGIITIEFLLKTFEKMFSYEFTKKMECNLDEVSSGKEKEWSNICKICLSEIRELSKEIKNMNKQSYPIENDYEIIFACFGPVIKHAISESNDKKTYEYLQVRKDIQIDLDKVKRREYKLEDLLERKDNYLGIYEGEPMYIKNGQYGPYVEWGKKRESIKGINKKMNEIVLEDIQSFLSSNFQNKLDKNILRKFNDVMSIRKGKFGPYLFYQRPEMPKPEFYNIRKYKDSFFGCDADEFVEWVCETYDLPIPTAS